MSKALIPEFSLFLAFTLTFSLCAPPLPAQQQQLPDNSPPFHISVLEGEGSINNIGQPVNRGATVMVEDENRNPLSGVAVSFFLPNDGPSGLVSERQSRADRVHR